MGWSRLSECTRSSCPILSASLVFSAAAIHDMSHTFNSIRRALSSSYDNGTLITDANLLGNTFLIFSHTYTYQLTFSRLRYESLRSSTLLTVHQCIYSWQEKVGTQIAVKFSLGALLHPFPPVLVQFNRKCNSDLSISRIVSFKIQLTCINY